MRAVYRAFEGIMQGPHSLIPYLEPGSIEPDIVGLGLVLSVVEWTAP